MPVPWCNEFPRQLAVVPDDSVTAQLRRASCRSSAAAAAVQVPAVFPKGVGSPAAGAKRRLPRNEVERSDNGAQPETALTIGGVEDER